MSGQRRSDKARAELVEDVAWLVQSGETHGETIAARVGMSVLGLDMALYRAAGRGDLTAADIRTRIDWHAKTQRAKR